MNLLAIKHYLVQVKMASLSSMCLMFNTDAETLRCRLQHWIIKGKVRICTKKPACGSKCFKCPTANIEIYEWVGDNLLA